VEGYTQPASPNAQYFDGTTWHTTLPVNPGSGAGFSSIKILLPTNIWAVGYAGKFTLTEKWNGSKWTIIPSANGNPNPQNAGISNILLSVNGTSSSLWAVGYYLDSAYAQHVLIERYTCQ
jgi:hypothetical protein